MIRHFSYSTNTVRLYVYGLSPVFRVVKVPAAPTSLSAAGGNNRITLRWDAVDSDDSVAPVTRHEYRRKIGTAPFGSWTAIDDSAQGGTNATSYTVTGLPNSTTYSFELRAVNEDLGHGSASEPVTATTLPAAPANLWPDPGDSQVVLSWDNPDDSTITEYQISSNAGASFTAIDSNDISKNDTDSILKHTATGLTNGTTYTLALRAVNASGEGPASSVTASPLPRPAAPANLLAKPANGLVSLSWSDPGNNTITRYRISSDTGTTFADISGSSYTTTSHVVTGLTNGDQYRFALRAVNASGEGPASTTTATPRWVAPTDLSAIPGDRQVTLTWTELDDPTATRYQYRQKTGTDNFGSWIDIPDSAPGAANASTYTVTGLTNGTTYTFELRAASASTQGPASTATATPLWPAPANLAGSPGNGKVELRWDRNAGISDYRVHTQSGGSAPMSSIFPSSGSGTKTTATVTGLTNGTEYNFTVSAVDVSGSMTVITGLPASVPATPAAVPDAPTNLSASQGDDGATTLTWSDPGDPSITNYQVSSNDGATFTDIGGSSAATTEHTVTGLANGTTYRLVLRAVNQTGEGLSSNTTAKPLYPAPTGLVAVPNNGQVTLQWDAGNPAITRYHILSEGLGSDINLSEGLGSDINTLAPAGTDLTVTGLTNGNNYTFTLRVALGTDTDPGNSTFISHPARVTATPLIALPATPTGLTAEPGNSQVALTWDDPNDITISGYDYSDDGGQTFTAITGLTAIPTSYTITGLTNFSQYSLALRAVNASGAGQAASVTATPITAPPAPVNFTATGLGDDDEATAGGGEVMLTWDNPGNSTITGYQHRQKRGSGNFGAWTDIAGSDQDTTTHTVTGLRNGSEYTIELRAVNTAGEGAGSSDTAKPLWPAPTFVEVKPEHGLVYLVFEFAHETGRISTATVGPGVGWYSGSSGSTKSRWSDAIGNDPNPDQQLTNDTEYTFTVWSRRGDSTQDSLKASVKATPVSLAPPADLMGLSATPGDSLIVLEWNDPDDITINKYQVRWKVQGSDDSTYTDWVDVTNANPYWYIPPAPTYTATGLTNRTTYTFSVRASNRTQAGPEAFVDGQPNAVPDAPENLSATAGHSQVTLMWNDPSNATITGYQVSSDAGDTFVNIPGSSAATTRHRVTVLSDGSDIPLINGTEYTFALRAVNALGEGLPATVEASPVSVPAAPAISSVAPGDREIALTWDDPNDSTITKYQVSSDAGASFIDISGSSATTTRYTVIVLSDGTNAALSNGTAYTLALRALNASGEGAVSTVIATMPPAAPTNLSATQEDDRQTTLSWDNPNNSTISGYQYRQAEGDDINTVGDWGDWIELSSSTAATTEYTVSGLTNGITYRFELRAVNASGSGTAAPEPTDQAVTARPLWPAPTNLETTPGDSEMELEWDNIDPDVTNYLINVDYSKTGTPYSRMAVKAEPDDANKIATVMLMSTNSIDYTFKVQAARVSGGVILPSGKQANATARPVPVPAAPLNVQAMPANQQALLSWNDPDDSSISAYQIRQAEGQGSTAFSDWSNIDGSSAATTEHTLTGLTNGTEYTFELRAVNASGEGGVSAANATPIAVPRAPDNLSPRPGDGQVTLTWDNPGDSTITGYQVSTDAGASFINISGSDATTTGYTVTVLSDGTNTPLTNGRQYTLALRAGNSQGEGPSASVTATPTLPLQVPAAPVISSVMPDYDQTHQVALTWDDPNNNTITKYQISTDAGANFADISGSSATTTDHSVTVLSDGTNTPLTNRTLYRIALRAVNDAGAGSSASVNATTLNNTPVSSDKTVSMKQNESYVFAVTDFAFDDDDASDALDHVKIILLPGKGRLSLDGTDITDVSTPPQLTKAELDQAKLVYTPPQDQYGQSFTMFQFKVNDGLHDSVAYTIRIDVQQVANNLPRSSNNTVLANENEPTVFTMRDFAFEDDDASDTLDHVKIISLPGDNEGTDKGTLSLNDMPITSIDVNAPPQLKKDDLDNGRFIYTLSDDAPVGAFTAFTTFQFKVNDGQDDSVNSYTISVDVEQVNVNSEPVSSASEIAIKEDTPRILSSTDFPFSSSENTNTELNHVKITSLPSTDKGKLSLDNNDISEASDNEPVKVTKNQLDNNKLIYTPPQNANGKSFAAFNFKLNVDDDDGSVDIEPVQKITINVAAANDAPTSSGNSVVSGKEDEAYVFKQEDFNFADVDADAELDHVKIISLPGGDGNTDKGTLSLAGMEITDITTSLQVSKQDLVNKEFKYTPPENAEGKPFTSFQFKVNDGLVDSTDEYTMTINLKAMNDAPTSSDNPVVAGKEDEDYVFKQEDFNFVDVDIDAELDHVKIISLPGGDGNTDKGTLSLAGKEITDITTPLQVSKQDLVNEEFKYTPPENAEGKPFTSFRFKVNDGLVDSTDEYTMTINLKAMNDSPTASDNAVSTDKNKSYVFKLEDFGMKDVDVVDGADMLDHVKIISLPGGDGDTDKGTLSLAGKEITDVTTPPQVSKQDLVKEEFKYTPPENAEGEPFTSFRFKVNDGLVDSTDAYTMTINVLQVHLVRFGAASYAANDGEPGSDTVAVEVQLHLPAAVALTIPITITPQGKTTPDDYEVGGLDASTGQDVASTLRFGLGEATKSFTIRAKKDDDFDNETVLLGFGSLPERVEAAEPDTATLTITDAEGVAVRARFTRLNDEILSKHALTIADLTNRAVAARMDDACGPQPLAYTLAGGSTIAQILQSNGQAIEDGTLNLDGVLARSSFRLPLQALNDATAGGDRGGPVLWGLGDRHRLGSRDSDFAWDGTVLTGQFGLDTCPHDDVVTGLTLSRSIGAFDYSDDSGREPVRGEYESRMSGAHPYLGWSSPHGLRLWTTVGYGRGEIEIDDGQAGRQISDTTLTTAATGASGPLMPSRSLSAGVITTLRIKGEASVAKVEVVGNDDLIENQTVEGRRLRLALEGSHERALASGRSLTPSLELGLRHDGGDGVTGGGLEIGGSLRYRDPAKGLTIEGRGRVLTRQGDERQWGLGGSFHLGPGASGLGLSVSVTPVYGDLSSGVAGLWDQEVAALTLEHRAARDSQSQGLLDAELGYGISALGGHGLLTPYLGLSLAGNNSRDYRLGGRLDLAPSLSLGLEGQRREQITAPPDHGMALQLELHW